MLEEINGALLDFKQIRGGSLTDGALTGAAVHAEATPCILLLTRAHI